MNYKCDKDGEDKYCLENFDRKTSWKSQPETTKKKRKIDMIFLKWKVVRMKIGLKLLVTVSICWLLQFELWGLPYRVWGSHDRETLIFGFQT